MLRYLNGEYNSAVAPDENYARELQELFTVGKGADAQFTEADVQAAAKVLTGYRINPLDHTQWFFNGFEHNSTNERFRPSIQTRLSTVKRVNTVNMN